MTWRRRQTLRLVSETCQKGALIVSIVGSQACKLLGQILTLNGVERLAAASIDGLLRPADRRGFA